MITVRKLCSNARIPKKRCTYDNSFDIFALNDGMVHSQRLQVIHTGIAIGIPKDYIGIIYPRKRLAMREKITLLNSPMILEPNNDLEVRLTLQSFSDTLFEIKAGDCIAKLVVIYSPSQEISIEENLFVDEEQSYG